MEADRALVTTARAATARSYVPYSAFLSGCSRTAGRWNCGVRHEIRRKCRISVGTLRGTYHTVLCQPGTPTSLSSHLLSPPERRKDFIDNPIPPCGACRQVILETEKRYGQPIRILLYGKECIYEIKSIGDLLPLSFDASAMED